MKTTKYEFVRAFLLSYDGIILLTGIIILICQIIFLHMDILNKNDWIGNIINPLFISIEAAVIFYFISDYLPNTRDKKIQLKVLQPAIKEIKKLLWIALFDLGITPKQTYNNDWTKFSFFYENQNKFINKSILENPDLFQCPDIKRPEGMNKALNWIEYFNELLNEEEKILSQLVMTQSLHRNVLTKIHELNEGLGLRPYINNLKIMDFDLIEEKFKKEITQLARLALMLELHIKHISIIDKQLILSSYLDK